MFERTKAFNFFRKELKKIKESPEQVHKRIAIFYEEYNKQSIIIDEKLKQTLSLQHKENYNRILEYKNDVDNLKSKIDKFVIDIEDEKKKKSLGEKIKQSKMGVFVLIFRDMNRINNKYKKENCDIDNFKV